MADTTSTKRRTAAVVAIGKIHDCIERDQFGLVWDRLAIETRCLWLAWCAIDSLNAVRAWSDFNTAERKELARALKLRVQFFAFAGMDHLRARVAA